MSQNKERIFITGGAGYVGSAITKLAVTEGYEVRGLSRSETSDAKLIKMGATPVRGDLNSLDVLRAESAAADIVIHLADPFKFDHSGGYDEVRRIQATVTDAFVDGMKGTNKPLVTTSGALVVAADPNGGETTEDSPKPPNPAVPRHLVEEYDLSAAKKGVKVSVIRLAPYVYGHGGSSTGRFMHMFAQRGEVVYIGEGTKRTSTVHVDDAARLYLLVAKHAKAGTIFTASSSTTVTLRQLAEAMAEALHIPARSLTPEETTAQFGKFFTWFLSTENRGSNAKAVKELGWQPKETAGILEEIRSGSYQALAQEIRNRKAA
ncbi:hypothetical protein AAE478_010317 [Parahypoxylon ruwenzoriense]